MATDPQLGTRIRDARDSKRWTQQELADAIGVNVKSVDNWENARSKPRSALPALEKALGVSLRGGAAASGEMEELRAEAAELRETVLSQATLIAQLMRSREQHSNTRKNQEQDDEPEQGRGRFRNAV